MAKNLIILILLVFTSATNLFAQQFEVSGQIVDEFNTPLPGVSIYIKNTTEGTISDLDGNFKIQAPLNSVVVVSMVGMLEEEFPVTSNATLNITLIRDIAELEEIIVVGYGTLKKSDLTGAVAKVEGSDMVKITSSNPMQSLQGKVTGVQITSTSGAPGADAVVRIRGVGTLNNSKPIYVIDGVISNDISFVNSADIESVEVLKDASATAIYGSRGSNGVIMVTTKAGKKGGGITQFNYNGEVGIQVLTTSIDLLNGKEYGDYTNKISFTYNDTEKLPNTDWQDLIFKPAGIMNHQLSAAGSTEKTNYFLSVGYYKQEGIIEKSSYERLTIRLNNTYKLTDFIDLGNNFTITPYKQQFAPNATYNAYRANPTLLPYREDGSYAGVPGVGNPLADIAYSNNYDNAVRALGNLFIQATLFKNFTFKSSYGIDGLYKKNENFTPAFNVLYYDGTQSMQSNPTSDLSKRTEENFTWIWENTLSFIRDYDKHSFNIVAGYTMQNSRSEFLKVEGENIIRDGEDFWYLQPSYITDEKVDKLENKVDNNLNYSMISYLFRANYTYNDKYILTATFRRDGSSKFSKENRYSNFPSFAAGWNIAEEAFMQSLPFIFSMKLRASWGQIGNEKIAYEKRFAGTDNLYAVFGPGDIVYPGVSYGKSGNPDLLWETTTQSDIGLEISTFQGKLSGEFDFYHRVTDDILVDLTTPGHLGNGQGQKVTYNAAEVLNYGFEAAINWREKRGDFGYGVGVNATTVHNEVLNVGGNSGVDSLLFGGNISGFTTQTREGLPIGAFWGYQTNGLFQTQEDLDSYPHTSDAGLGDLRRVDVSGDGRIDGQDRTYIGSPIPTLIFGFNLELSYKNFDFSMNIQGQSGSKILNGKEIVRPDRYNFEKHVVDAWTGPGTTNTEPRASWGGYNYVPSDWFIQDASFVRLRNMVLAYTLPVELTSKAKINKMRLYVKGDNLYTLTKFTGYTPEIASEASLDNAIDMGTYPIPALYSFGINLSF